MYALAKKVLFLLQPETAHNLTLSTLGSAQALGLFRASSSGRSVEAMGLHFPNPVGLAAGLDKNGEHVDAFGKLGFGFIEVGTVTPLPQDGNPKPRMFRLPEHRAVINRMGFNNHGVDALAQRVKDRSYPGVLGINLGKNKATPNENAVDDYLIGLRAVYSVADYVTVNLSSPNTPGLRDLQGEAEMRALLSRLLQERENLAATHGKTVPLTVKIAPDLADDAIEQLAKMFLELGIDGVIATNTTIAREAVAGHKHGAEAGGLSGAPVTQRSTEVVARLHAVLGDAIPIIGVGGICSVADAQAKLDAGAKLIQVYTGLVFEGPGLVKRLVQSL